MVSSGSTPSPQDAPVEADDNAAEMLMTMAASVVLEHLPKDAHKALETAGELEQAKGKTSRERHVVNRRDFSLV